MGIVRVRDTEPATEETAKVKKEEECRAENNGSGICVHDGMMIQSLGHVLFLIIRLSQSRCGWRRRGEPESAIRLTVSRGSFELLSLQPKEICLVSRPLSSIWCPLPAAVGALRGHALD